MSRNLPAPAALELLDNFKATVQELAARAEKLNEGLLTTQSRERRRYEAALEEQKKQLSTALTEAEATFQSEKVNAQTRYEKRKLRIGKAYQASREQRLKRIDEKLGGCRYELQKKMLQAEKDRDSGLATATASLQEFKQNLAAEQATLAKLEEEAQRAFSGYAKFKQLFFTAYETTQGEASGDEHKLLADLREELSSAGRELARFRGFVLLRLVKFLPVWVVLLLGALLLGIQYFRLQSVSQMEVVAVAAGAILLIAVRFVAQARASA